MNIEPVSRITLEIADLLKVTVPWVVKALRSPSYNSKLASISDDIDEGRKELEGVWADIPETRRKEILTSFYTITQNQKNLDLKPWWKSFQSKSLALNQCRNDAAGWLRIARSTTLEVASGARNIMRDQSVDTTQIRLAETSNNVGTDSVALLQALQQEISNLSCPTTVINNGYAAVRHETTTYNNNPPVGQKASVLSGGAVQHSSDFLSPHPSDPTTEDSRMSDVVVAITNAVMQVSSTLGPEPVSSG